MTFLSLVVEFSVSVFFSNTSFCRVQVDYAIVDIGPQKNIFLVKNKMFGTARMHGFVFFV